MIRKTPLQVLAPVLSAAVLSIALAGCGGNTADTTTATAPDTTTTTTTTDNAMADNTMADNSTAMSSAPASADSFTAAAATWKEVESANAELDAVIKANKLAQVHEAAFKVRDLVKKLPADSQSLAADKQSTLTTQVKNVEQLAGKLDEAGDSKNMAATKDNQTGLNDTLDVIKGLYPAGALS